MISKGNSFYSLLKILNIFNVIFVSILLSIIYGIFTLKEEDVRVPHLSALSREKEKRVALSFPKNEPSFFQTPMNDLSNSLKIYKVPLKPNQDTGENLFIEFERKLYPLTDSKMYLRVQNNELVLSEKKSNSFFEIKNINSSSLKIVQVCHLNKPFNKKLRKKYEIFIQPLKSDDLCFQAPFLELKNCEFLGLDKLASLEGIPNYLIKIKEKIYSVQKNTVLSFDKEWKIGSLRDRACAFINEINAKEVVIELWDAKNTKYNKISLNKKNLPKRNLRISDFVSDIHMRSKQKISLLIEKQKMFVQESDILVKRAGKWLLFSKKYDDDQNEMYIILKKIKKNREIELNVLEKNRIILHNFTIPVSRGSFAKKLRP